MQNKPKFDNVDRRRVVAEIERQMASRLSRVGRREIYLKDDSGNRYVVLGGIEDWHGIPDDVMEDIGAHHGQSYLAIALKKVNSLKVYLGGVKALRKALKGLNRPGNDKYTFRIDEHQDHLVIREDRSVTLNLLSEIPHSESDRKQMADNAEKEKILKKMSIADLEELLGKIKKES